VDMNCSALWPTRPPQPKNAAYFLEQWIEEPVPGARCPVYIFAKIGISSYLNRLRS
jgi:hypothetical protein